MDMEMNLVFHERRRILWQNIIIKYFNGGKYTEDEIKSVEELHYSNSMEAFYIIPILIFCLEYTIEKMLK